MQHLIHNDAQRPNIYLLVVGLFPCDLRRHIEEGADGGLPESDFVDEAEVDDLYPLLLAVDEDVLGFEVPVDIALVVDVLEGLQDLLGDDFDLILGMEGLLEVGLQSDAAILHQQPDFIFGLLVVVELDDVRMIQRIQDPYLIGQSAVLFLKSAFRNLLLVDGLERVSDASKAHVIDLAESLFLPDGTDIDCLLQVEGKAVGDLDAAYASHGHAGLQS